MNRNGLTATYFGRTFDLDKGGQSKLNLNPTLLKTGLRSGSESESLSATPDTECALRPATAGNRLPGLRRIQPN